MKKILPLLFVAISVNVSAQPILLTKDLTGSMGGSAFSQKMKISSTGETFIVSEAGNASCGAGAFISSELFIYKYDASKNCVWSLSSSLSNPVDKTIHLMDMTLDANNDLILVGWYQSLNSTYSLTFGTKTLTIGNTNSDRICFVAKIIGSGGSQGTCAWLKPLYDAPDNSANPANRSYFFNLSIAADGFNNIFLSSTMMYGIVYDGTLRVSGSDRIFVLQIKASDGTYLSNRVGTSFNGASTYLSYNSAASRLVMVSTAGVRTSSSFQFGNGATLTESTANSQGIYVGSMTTTTTSFSVSAQAYFKDYTYENSLHAPVSIVNSGDSIIVLNRVYGAPVYGSTTLTASGTAMGLALVKLNATTPTAVAWARLVSSNQSSSNSHRLVRGNGGNVYLYGNIYDNLDFGNSVTITASSSYQKNYLANVNSSNGLGNWVINVPYTTDLAYNASESAINFLFFDLTFYGNYYRNAIFKLDTRLKITSVTAAASLCPGNTFTVNFFFSQTPSAGNVYTLQLSDEEGTFSNPKNIGTLTSTALSGTITGTIPSNIEGSTYMRLRVTASAPAVIGLEANQLLTVGIPNNIATLNGPAATFTKLVCEQLNYDFAASFTNYTSFQWQANTGSGFVNVSNNAVYSGTTTQTMSVATVPLSYNGYQYRLLINNSACPAVQVSYTNTFLTVQARPTVTSVTPSSRCDAGQDTLVGTASTGASIYWYNALTGGSRLSAANPYKLIVPATTTYYADATINGCFSFARTPVTISIVTTPTITNTVPASRCGAGTLTLGATPSLGSVSWYSTLTGGSSIGVGTSYTTPSIATTTTYYAQANNSGCLSSPRTAVVATVNPIPTITGFTPAARCDAGAITVSATSSAGSTVRWYDAATGGSFITASNSYSTSLSATATYFVDALTAVCTTATRTSVAATVTPTPTIASVTSGQHCDTGPVLISATPSAGSINWYTLATGGTPLTTALSYTTPSLSSATTYYAEATNNGCNAASRTAVTASIYPSPVFSLTKTDPTVCGTANGSITISGLTAFAFYGVAYNGGSSSNYPTDGSGAITLTSLAAGAYSNITVTSQNSCTTVNAAGLNLSAPSTPTILTTTPASRCDPGSLTLNATASTGTISWYAASSGGTALVTGPSYNTPSISATTIYYAEAVSGSCASSRAAVTATVTIIPTITGTTPVSSCSSGSFALGATSSAGTINWYTSSSGGTSQGTGTSFSTPVLSSTTSYYVEATLSGCTTATRTSIQAVINTIPTVSSVTPDSRCDTGVLTLGATPSAGTINWFTASTGGTTQGSGTSFVTPSISSSTTYYAEASNGSCNSTSRTAVTATVTVTPSVTGSTGASRCNPGTLLLSSISSAGTINWYTSSSGGTSQGTGTNFTTPSLSASTVYYVDATLNGCASAGRTAVNADIYSIPSIAGYTNGSRCDVGTVGIQAVPSAGTIAWYAASSGGTTLGTGNSYTTPSLSVSTTYYAEAKIGTCVSASRQAVVAAVVNTPTVTGVTPGSGCGTGSVLLGATSSAGVLNWYSASTGGASLSTGASFATPSISTNTTYFVEANVSGCISARSSVLATIKTVPSFTLSSVNPSSCGTPTGSFSILGLTVSTNYNVAYNGGGAQAKTSDGTGKIMINALGAGGYSNIIVTDPNGCSTTDIPGVALTDPSAPSISGVSNASRCNSGTVSLGASAATGTINWYLVPTGGTIQGTGNSFITPSITVTTTYYVDVVSGGCTSGRTSVTATVNKTPTVTPVNGTRCDAGAVNLSVTVDVGTVEWYNAAFSGTQVSTTLNYTTPSISTTTIYYAEGSNNGCTAARVPVTATVVTTPSLSLTPAARCDAGSVALTGSSGGTISWYSVSTGGTSIGSGTSFGTPSISSSTTYYAEAATGACISARQSVLATVNTTPSISGTSPASRCNNGTLTLSVSVGTGIVNWYAASSGGTSLTTSATFITPSISTTTLYYADVTSNGCTSTPRTSVMATVTSTPTIVSTTDGSRCDAGTVGLNASASAGTLNWYTVNTGGTSQGTGINFTTPAIGVSTTYYVDATLSGCISARTAVLATVTTTPAVTGVTPGSNCGPGSVSLSAVSGTGTISWYAASTGGTSLQTGTSYNTPSISANTTYYVSASLNGCVSSPRTSVQASITGIPTITGTTPASRCDLGTLTLSATPSTGSIKWYSVSTGGTSLSTGNNYVTPSIGTTTTYYAEAVNGSCPSSRTAVVATVTTTPTISGTLDVARCGTGTINLTASSSTGTIQWFAAITGGTSLGTGTTYATSSLNSTTTYYLSATLNGCTSSPRASIKAVINALPAFTVASSHPTACLATNGSFTLSGLAPTVSYNFKYGVVPSQPITTSASGTYTQANLAAGSYNGIIITDSKNCSSLSATAILVDPNAPSIDAGLPQTVCQGDIVTLTASNPDNAGLSWSTGETTNTTTFTASGSGSTLYTVTATLAGCTSTDNVAVTVRSEQHIINFPAIAAQNVFSTPFSLSAASSASLPVVYSSLDPSVATVSGNIVTIVGPGTGYIKVSQGGNTCYNTAPDSVQSFVVTGKLNQVINFGSFPPITFGDSPFALGATVNSPNPVVYEVSDPSVATIVNGNVTGLKEGTITVKAYASGSANYNASDTVIQTLRVIVPAFKIFGSTTVQGNNKEDYFLSPNSNKYSYSWNYKGANTYFVSDTVSKSVGLFFTNTAIGDTLRCRVYSIASNTYLDVRLAIEVISDVVGLPPINCDSLKGTLNICSGKYINNFILQGAENNISNFNSDCDQGYSDYTRLGNAYTTSLYLGDSYNAEVQIGNKSNGNGSENYIGVWLDYNNNGSFDDPNEFLISINSTDSIIKLKNLLISTNENFAGARRLRIRMRSSGLFTFGESCVEFNEGGETEDYSITLVVPDRLVAPVLLTPNDDGKNDFFIIKGIYNKPDAGENKLIILDRIGQVLFTEVNYSNAWSGKDSDNKLLPRDTYYYNFINGDGNVIRGYFEIRY